jgi:hypothetical protein
MLSTKDMSAGNGRIKPVMGTGNSVIRINTITFDVTPYDADAYNIILHVEGEPEGTDFQGFLKDVANPNGPRYEGQVGRIRFSPYPYKDTTLPSGIEIKRDNEVLKGMIFLSEVLNKRDALDKIEANTIEDFMVECNKLFSNSEFFNACIGGREWENKDGYINLDLFLPRMSKDGIPLEAVNKENSRLLTFNENEHVRKIQKKEGSNTNTNFEPATTVNAGDDFDL